MNQQTSASAALQLLDAVDASVNVTRLSAGSVSDTGCIGVSQPTLRWQLDGERPGIRQLAYQIEIAGDPGFANMLGGSLPVSSSRPTAEVWPGPALASRQVCWARVRVWTDLGTTGWSDGLRVEATLLSQDDWIARPISPLSNCERFEAAPVPLVRKAFRIDKPVAQARLYVSAIGIQDTWINGAPLSDAYLEPGWTSYQERLLYAVHDLTDRLCEGENVLSAAIGDGWWRGWLTWMERRAVYGKTTAYLAQLEITYADGTTETIGTDNSWRGGNGAVREADLYNGSVIDARAEPEGWRSIGFDDTRWEPVREMALPMGLELRSMPPVRIVQRWSLIPRQVGPGRWIVDVGQNLAGFLNIRVRGNSGDAIIVRHAELLDNDGELHTAPLRNARATDKFVLADDELAILEPAFTFHGFRYAEITADFDVTLDHVEVCALSTDMPQIGTFECNDSRVNKLYRNVRWSQLGNFVALPTDCPQRDERLGWTGDIQVFSDTACTNAAAGPFLASWLRDLAIEQRADGNVTSTVPNVISGHEFEYGGVGWGDAATLVPWSIFLATGNLDVLRAQFESMCKWVDYGASRRDDDGTWSRDFQLGDWLDPGAPADQPEKATTDSNFIATAYLSRSAAVVAQAARLIGRSELVEPYAELSRVVADAAWQRWADHLITTQAGCALAIQFDIAPADQLQRVGAALATLVDRNGGRIATGFLGTPLVLPALTRTGHIEAAYRLLLNEDCPGWLFQVKHGATTMWERWDAVKEDGTLHAGEMTSGEGSSMISYNHYAYGAVALWLYQTVAGIAPDSRRPGYEFVRFAPQPGPGFTSARASIDTPFGTSGITWEIGTSGTLEVDIQIAAGASGEFVVPAGWRLEASDSDTTLLEFASGRHRLLLRA